MSPLLVVVVGLTVVITLAVFVALASLPIRLAIAQSRTQRAFAELARSLGAEPKGEAFRISVAGHRVKVSLFSPGKSEPLALRVSVPGARPMSPPIVMRRERWLDRLGKRLGINREVQVGEPGFDGAVYIDTRAPDEVVRELLGDEGRRRAVVEIFALGFTQVEVAESFRGMDVTEAGRGVVATRERPEEACFASHAVLRAAQALTEIAAGVPAVAAVPEPAWRWWRVVAWIVGLGVAFTAGIGALGVAMAAKDAYPPIGSSFYAVVVPAGIGVYVALIPVAAMVLRGRSDSLRRLGFTAAVGAYVVPCYTAALLLTINGGLDASRPAHAESRVLARWVTSGKSPERKVRLAGVRGGEEIELTVGRALYDRLAEGDAVTVVTGEGALGWRWVQRVEAGKRKGRK